MGLVLAAHQPNYLPWIGYFHKILKSDIFVILDHVEFSRRGFINRNRVKGPKGVIWLTVPVRVKGRERIMNVKIDNKRDWRRKHHLTLKSFYGKAPYFNDVFPSLEDVYEREWEYLADLNIEIITRIVDLLGIKARFVKSSSLNPQGKKMDMIIDICKKMGASIYFSGKGARKYQDEETFERNGIKLVYQDIEVPEYPQRFGEFVPNLSIIDMVFNIGVEETKNILERL
ncbi:MAG: WbqC family protein [Thermoplasmata archaeon]|nr:WbqC family protein [Thermoplasmata archaeon]